MSRRTPPSLATSLLRHVNRNDALAGDLAEAYAAGKSAWWYWGQVLAVVASGAYRAVRPSLWWSGAATAAAMAIIEVPMLLHLPMAVSAGRLMLLALYLIPAAATIAAPVGLTVGSVCGSRPRTSSRVVPVTLIIAVCGMLATFVMLGWVVPDLNQSFRYTLAGRLVARGAPELTIVELRSLLGAGDTARHALAPLSDSWDIAVNYYGRWAVSFTPLAFAIFGLWAATLERTARRVVVLATACAYLVFVLGAPEWYRLFPPALVAWAPPALLATLPVLAGWLRRRK